MKLLHEYHIFLLDGIFFITQSFQKQSNRNLEWR